MMPQEEGVDWPVGATCAVCARPVGEQHQIWWFQATAGSVLYTFCSGEHRSQWLQELLGDTAVPETLVRCAICDTEIQEVEALSFADFPGTHFCSGHHAEQWWEKHMEQQRPSAAFHALTLALKPEFVSCVTCAACYDDRNQPTYCQEFKTAVDPRKIGHNMRTAAQCAYFWPHGFPREARAHV